MAGAVETLPSASNKGRPNSSFCLTLGRSRLTIQAMQSTQPLKRGGRRIGAGRPKGNGRYRELTIPVRVPAKLAGEVKAFVRRHQFAQPVYVVGLKVDKPRS